MSMAMLLGTSRTSCLPGPRGRRQFTYTLSPWKLVTLLFKHTFSRFVRVLQYDDGNTAEIPFVAGKC